MKKYLYYFLFFCGSILHAQVDTVEVKKTSFILSSDRIVIDSLSISPYYFKVFDANARTIPRSNYTIDFGKALLSLDHIRYPRITVHYKSLPKFLTRTYQVFDDELIIPRITNLSRMYTAQQKKKTNKYIPFDGLNTSGNISRGITVGNNQDAVVNSNFDLQLSGNLTNGVKIRGSITDTNVPLQNNGYTQRLEEFDRVFVELEANLWRIQAGDINLTNREGKFLRFDKKVAGLQVQANNKDEKWKYFASGALVRGQFDRKEINGQEGNQGPYKINNSSLEQFILLVSGSESVYVNGRELRRGENNDYVIDYNTAEITFTPTFPINSNMRIVVEYQFSERNYTRFVTYDGLSFEDDKFQIGFNFYNESDLKNSTVQLDLNDSQKQILANAGDDRSAMMIPSAVPSVFEEQSILYKKEVLNGIETFVFSDDPNDDLFRVKFNFIGFGLGSYTIQTTIATGRIYEFVGLGNGEYEPIVQLVAPNKLQILQLDASYKPNDKTSFRTEMAMSNNDENLFSSLDDDDNNGLAAHVNWRQIILDKSWRLSTETDIEWISKAYKTLERIQAIEFQRDWNLLNPLGNQQMFGAEIQLENAEKGHFSYAFNHLKFDQNYTGQKHGLSTALTFGNWQISAKAESLNTEGDKQNSFFNRWNSHVKLNLGKSWIGARFNGEQRIREDNVTGDKDLLSHQYLDAVGYFGFGDTTKVHTEIGYNYSHSDSLKLNVMNRVNHANSFYIKSQLIQGPKSNLSVYLSYRLLNSSFYKDEESLNSRILYRQQVANNALNFQTVYETSSGALPQQEYSYIEVDTGQGFYTWVDYNENGIQELDEFEQAQFQDQANYLRVLLPTLNFLKTNQNKFSQSLTMQLLKWQQKSGFKKFVSKFQNQTTILLNSKQLRTQGFELNPFNISGDDVLALNTQYKNSLYFNRGKQHYSGIYTFLNTQQKSTFSIGDLDQSIRQHQFNIEHKFGDFWLLGGQYSFGNNNYTSNRFSSRNYELKEVTAKPMLSYVLGKQSRIEGSYAYNLKSNKINGFEEYVNHTLGVTYRFSKDRKFSTFGSFQYLENSFVGNANSPVAYQMLEGLRPGTNFTWNFGFQKRITSYLDLNITYFGRKSEMSRAIHTGSMQLRANL